MDLFRLLFAPFVPPLIYGLICIPLSQFVLTLFPNAVTAQGNFSRPTMSNEKNDHRLQAITSLMHQIDHHSSANPIQPSQLES